MRSSAVAATPLSPADQPVIKRPTGIAGFDEITGGGLPKNRLTTIFGGAGVGKTVFALQTLVNRSRNYGEAGIFVTFEEPAATIRSTIASFDWQFTNFSDGGLIFIDARLPVDAMFAGAFDLTATLMGITALEEKHGLQNIVFDGIDMLLSGLEDDRLERRELARLHEWVRNSELSALMTVKSVTSDRDQRRAEYLQYMTDCIVILEDTVTKTTRSRSLRIAKYRGSGFSGNPAPIVIGHSGFDVVTLKNMRSIYPVFTDRIASGVPRLDALLGGGYARGSSILLTGAPGTAKTSLGAYFVAAACKAGKKALFLSFDESASQVVVNMKSIGLDLQPSIVAGHLRIESLLADERSPEEQFVVIRRLLEMHSPDCLVIDPLSALLSANYPFAGMIFRCLLEEAKSRGITILCTSILAQESEYPKTLESNIATAADTWLHVTYTANEGERNRALTIIKSRGVDHSNQVRQLVLTAAGIDLSDVYVAEGQVLMGSARMQKETEVRRQKAEGVIAHQRVLAELQNKIRAATQELEWRQKEAVFLEHSEVDRAEDERVSSVERLDLRRSGDDAGAGSPPATRRRRRMP